MGNQQSSQANEVFYEKLKLVKSLGHSKALMQNPKTLQLCVAIQNTFPSESQAIQYYHELKKRIEPCHQYYLGPIKSFILANNTFCSKQYKAIQIYPYEQYTLKDQIQSREQQKRYFDDKQIWSVLCSCVLVMANFTRSQIIHLQLSPSDIILNADGQIKVISSDISEYQIDYIFKKGFYYAPQTLKNLKNKTQQKDTNKASVFTLGMTILHAILLQNLTDLYYEDFTFDSHQLNHKISKIQSNQMRDILVKMLKLAPYQRISFTQLQQMLYSILQNNDQEIQDQQIEKLQQSIYRINTQFQPNHKNNLISLPNDTQDFPDQQLPMFDNDFQIIDESDQNKNNQDLTKIQQQNKGVFTDKTLISTDIDNRQNSLIVQKNRNKSEITEISQKQAPIYVNEQYSKGRYEGYKQFGMRHGFGTFHYQQGGRYSGEWKFNKMEGRGALYYSSGDIAYEGEWKDDKLHGYGVLYSENPVYITSQIDWVHLNRIAASEVKYEGNFSQDQKNGQGTLFLSNGEYYRGHFQKDLPSGKGLFRRMNGQLIKGTWQDGIFIKHES